MAECVPTPEPQLLDPLDLVDDQDDPIPQDWGPPADVLEKLKQHSKYVKLNVGGALYTTTIGTLVKQDNMLRAMFSGRMELQTDEEGKLRIVCCFINFIEHPYCLRPPYHRLGPY